MNAKKRQMMPAAGAAQRTAAARTEHAMLGAVPAAGCIASILYCTELQRDAPE